jgi:hypothetical protein
MQQRPQAPQMPTPGKASPMAGLGSVDDRVDVYKGNTKPLEQRYAMSQDLLDLLALQKIKSQKDAAARQMQLQMAQQSAEGGQANMTVAQQREQEVDALTKNELAQQRGDTAQKQAGDQQAAMQKMMGGIAGAPGAAMAAQPKAMAAGGIVGYAGPEGSSVGKRPLDADAQAELQEAQRTGDRNAMMMTIKKLAAAGYDVATLLPRGVLGAAESVVRGVADSRVGRALGLDAIPKLPEAVFGGDRTSMTPMMDKVRREEQAAGQPPPPARPTSVSEAQATAAAGPQAAVPPAEKLPPANVVAAAQGAPRPPAAPKPPGLPGLPGAAGAPPQVQLGAVGPANDFGQKLEAAALKNAQIDPAARQLEEEKRIESRMALTPEQRKVYEEGIGGLQKMYNEQYDPERQQREGLKRALIGAGGRRYGEFAGAATAGMNYDEKQRAAKLKEFGDVQNARTGLIGIDRANVKGGIEGGQKAYEQSSISQRQGLDSGRALYGEDVKSRDSLYSTNVTSRDKALDREIDKLKVQATAESNRIASENLSFDKARTIYATTLNKVEQLERNLEKDFASGPLGMLMMQDPAKLKPEDKNRLEIAKLELEQKKAKIRKELEPVLESARQKLGVTGSNLSASDKALVDKYAKGK